MNYLLLAMKRSGQHGIINWIQAQKQITHYNNCCFGWKDKQLIPMSKNMKVDLSKESICNIEDFDLDDYNDFSFKDFPYMNNTKIIILVRDPFNWLASCYKRKNASIIDHRDVYRALNKEYINDRKIKKEPRLELYKKYIRQWNKEFNYLDREPVYINFNNWFTSIEYRQQIAKNLDLEFTDQGLNKVAGVGNGSSFDGTSYNGHAQKMDMLNRWLQFDKDEEFNRYLDNRMRLFAETEFGIKN